MQITRIEVIPVELKLREVVRMAGLPEIRHITAIFLRLELRDGRSAWGCTVAHPDLTGEKPADVVRACQAASALAGDLNPLNMEYSLGVVASKLKHSPAALCAFDLALYDLLGLAADMPLYRLLGGFRDRIQTSATVTIAPVEESVEMAQARAGLGFRMLKIKGGVNSEEDVQRVKAIHRALPDHTLRLDADGGYSVKQALDVARELGKMIEMLEQPTPTADLEGLREVTHYSPVPVLADQSARTPASALTLVGGQMVNGLSVKLATCGGVHCAQQMVAVVRAARLDVMISCVVEPALLTAAGLSLALSSPAVRYGDLDGFLFVANDPTEPGFRLQDGWLIAGNRPGLGCGVTLG